MKTLAVVDLGAIFWRAWYGMKRGQVTDARERSKRDILDYVRDSDRVAICCDHPAPTFRHTLFPDYKANRSEKRPLAVAELERLVEDLRDLGYPIYEKEGYEGDDLIATIVKWSADHFEHTTIVTADKDMLALVSERCSVHSTYHDKHYDIAGVTEEWGVGPSFVPELLALMGDSTDGIPGIPGVGVKRATELIRQFGTIEKLLENPDAIKDDKIRQSIMENVPLLHQCRELVRLADDVDIDMSPILEPRRATPPKSGPKQLAPEVEEAEFVDDGPANDTRLAKVAEPGSFAMELQPHSMKQVWWLGKQIVESGLFPELNTPAKAVMVILTGRELGITVMAAARGIHIIEGKVQLGAQLMQALCARVPDYEYFQMIESSAKLATYAAKRKSHPSETRLTYTIEEADQALLTRPPRPGKKPGNWHTRPKTMLRWRCVSELARIVFPEVVLGIYTEDELKDGEVYGAA